MGNFKLKVYHGGWFGYEKGLLQYLGGETTIIEDIDSDRWSLFEVYEELKQFGYHKEKISALWYKDPMDEDTEKDVKLFEGDTDALAMCRIAGMREHVELFVVHKVEENEVFPQSGYIDVRGDEEIGVKENRQEIMVYAEKQAVEEAQQHQQDEDVADFVGLSADEGRKQTKQGVDDGEVESSTHSDSDSLDSEYQPSGDENDSAHSEDYFTDSEDELDDDISGFEDVNVIRSKARAAKKKGVATNEFEDDQGVDIDEFELDHEVGIGADEEGGGEESEALIEGVRYPVHKAQKDMKQYNWAVGTLYSSREEFKNIVTAYAVHTARAITFRKCDLQRVRAVCAEECPFWLYAAKMPDEDTCQLRSMNLKHTCTQAHRVGIMHSKWLGKAFKKKVESNPNVMIKELVAKAQKKWNLTVSKSMTTRTKQIALDEIQGTFREQYKRIHDYGHELLRANPGSSVHIQVQRSPDFALETQTSSMTHYCIFQRIYICLDACKRSFQHCRPFIGLDECFLKTPQGGQLLTAIGWDPNDQMLPLAYAVVEAETKDSWTWFLNHLAFDVGTEKMGRATFMSDQQKGLLPAFEDVVPGVDNRFCVRHLYSNFRKKFPGLHLKQMMWRCAKATHWKDWEKYMAELRAVNEDAFRHLNAIAPRYWSRSRFTFNSKVETLVNNMSESFNSAIVDAREKPIITMLEEIRVKLMTRWAQNRELIHNYSGTILPRIRIKLEKRSQSAGEWRPYWSAAQKYEVANGMHKFVVDLTAHECSCRRWKMSGIPYVHAISCIKFKGLEIAVFVDNCYKKEAYLRCYEFVIQPLNGPELWERTDHGDVVPPSYRKPSHRPVKKRKRAAGEEDGSHTHLSRKGQIQRCTNCGAVGHKRGRCPKPVEEGQPSKNRKKGKKKMAATNNSAKGEKKIASTQPTPSIRKKRSTISASQPNPASQPNRPRGRLRKTTRPISSSQAASQSNTSAEAPTQPKHSSSQPNPTTNSTQPPPQVNHTLRETSSQPTRKYGQFSMGHVGAPHVSPRKLRLMAKLPPRKWGQI